MKKSSILLFLFILVLTFMTYQGIFLTFYQQDEWQTLGYVVSGSFKETVNYFSPLQLFFAEGRILSAIMYFLFYGFSRFSLIPIFIFALLVHSYNAFLLFNIGKRISQSIVTGVIVAIFFAISTAGNEGITWAAAIGTLPATTFFLLSFSSYLDFLETNNQQKKIFSFILGIVSLLFKETGLFIFIFYPLVYIIWKKQKNLWSVARIHAPLLLYGFILTIFRIGELFFTAKTAAGFVGGEGNRFVFPIIYHLVIYPLTSFFQLFITPADLYALAPIIARSEYTYLVGTPLFDLVSQSIIGDLLSVIGSVIILVLLFFLTVHDKRKQMITRFVPIGLALLFLSFLPYIVLHRYFSFFSSRYYYVGVAGAAFLFAYMVDYVYRKASSFFKVILILLVFFYAFHHIQAIQKDLSLQIRYATERKTFLHGITRIHPTIHDKNVFYITSDKKYLGEITYPFQSGLGYVLEVWYWNSGKIPKSYLIEKFLWDLGEEGYRENGETGFGYFEHLDKLAEFVKSGKITPSFVYGYVYNSQTHTFIDVTESVQDQLSTLSAEMQ